MITLGKKQEKENTAYILDYLQYGRSDDSRPIYQKKPLIQAVGSILTEDAVEHYFVSSS